MSCPVGAHTVIDDERLAFPQTSEHTNNNTEISEDIIHPDPLMRSRSSSFGSENDNNDFLEPLSEANHTPPSPSSLRNPSSQHSRPSSPVAGNAQSSDSNSAVILEPGDTPDMFERPTFVKEHRSIRLTYIKVAALHIVHHQDVLASNLDLKISLDCLWETGLDIPRNPKPATTLDTVLRRLNLHVDKFLRRQPVCSECYQRFTFNEIALAEVNKCYRTGCSGIFWRIKDGQRHPVKCIVYTRLVAALRRFMLRPEFVKSLFLGREAHDLEHKDGVLHDVCCGSAWLENRLGLKRFWRPSGYAIDRTTDGSPVDSTTRTVSLKYGLLAAVNIDWFGITEKYSVGAVYICFLNLHRSVRYRPENSILACVIPGPGEPSLEELNQVLDPLVEELQTLYDGVEMTVCEGDTTKTEKVHLSVLMTNNDSPARAKSTGRAGHAHHSSFCECECTHKDINTEYGYNIDAHKYMDEEEALRLARNSLDAPNNRERQRIADEYRMRWSSFNHLPQWKPYKNAPVDLMHNLYLGIVKAIWFLLIHTYYFSASQRREFDLFMDSVEWPSGIGRLPKNLATKGGLRKADEFRRLVTILPMALWSVWKDPNDLIPDKAEPIPESSDYTEDHIRSRKKIFDLIVLLSAASRILASWSITLEDVNHGMRLLQRYCQGLLRLGVHLQPNHHFSMHYERCFRLYGPAYAWWLFAFERFNGILEKVPINRHPEDYETILCRFWTRVQRIFEWKESMPADASERERNAINELCRSVGNRGTTLAVDAMLARETTYTTGKHSIRHVNLHSLPLEGLYYLMLEFARTCWPDLRLTSDVEPVPGGYPFLYDKAAETLPFVYRNGIKFGCATATRTKADRFAFVRFGQSLVPCRIEYLFRLTVEKKEPRLCAVVAQMMADNNIPLMPWDEYAEQLGAYTAYAKQFLPFQVVSIEQIVSPMALCQLKARAQSYPHQTLSLWVAILYDRTGSEANDDYSYNDEGEDGGLT
ncbi:Transposase family tnp2 [Ceratobasidium sp. AG-Ba]|nr:Transposase family tnp2 [Ceratobasidium sp. AG-Ba]